MHTVLNLEAEEYRTCMYIHFLLILKKNRQNPLYSPQKLDIHRYNNQNVCMYIIIMDFFCNVQLSQELFQPSINS